MKQSQNKQSKQSTRTQNKKKVAPKRKIKNRRKPRNTIPAANTQRFRRDFRVLYQDGNTVTVTGRDLIYQIPDTLTAPIQTTNIITCIPANPVYWTGTRISALTQGYQNYRPQYFKVTYVPQCAVTQQGNVIAGTIWNESPENNNLQQSLRTSNGGILTQCYKQASAIIRMRTNLQYNLYRVAGQFDQESNPFIFIAMAVGTTDANSNLIIPGYFYVTWKYTLKNPIGNTNTYYNSGMILYKNADINYENKTIVYLKPNDNLIRCGTIIQLEEDDNAVIPKYNNSLVAPGENDAVWEFANSSITSAINNSKIHSRKIIKYDTIGNGQEQAIRGSITINTNTKTIQTVVYNTDQTITTVEGKYYISSALNKQDFGELTTLNTSRVEFQASTSEYILQYENSSIAQTNGPDVKNGTSAIVRTGICRCTVDPSICLSSDSTPKTEIHQPTQQHNSTSPPDNQQIEEQEEEQEEISEENCKLLSENPESPFKAL